MSISLGLLIALVVFLIAFFGALGIFAAPAHLVLWLIAALALAIMLGGVDFPALVRKQP